jgi:hypothetical protein
MTSAVSKLNLQMAEQALRANRNLFSFVTGDPLLALARLWAATHLGLDRTHGTCPETVGKSGEGPAQKE